MPSPRWRQEGVENTKAKCASCGVEGVILQGTGGKEFKNVGGRFFCWKDICQEKSKEPQPPFPAASGS